MPRTKTFDENAVLEQAMQLFWEKGYAATSIQDLVDHLGINRASLYDTYGGKDQLFKRAFELYRNRSAESLQGFLSAEPNVRTGLELLFENTLRESLEDSARKGCFVVNATTELIPGHSELLPVLKGNKDRMVQILLDYLKKGESENQIEAGKDLRSIANMLYTLLSGLRVIAKVDPAREELSGAVSMALSILD